MIEIQCSNCRKELEIEIIQLGSVCNIRIEPCECSDQDEELREDLSEWMNKHNKLKVKYDQLVDGISKLT